MLLGVIADDFTGASDIANTLARGPEGEGLRTSQYLGVPNFPAGPTVEAGVVALKTRSVPAGAAVEESLRALRWLQDQGCKQYVFKYCSTFDSTPAGNIGPVGEALAAALDTKGVVACPAFPTLGRTVYRGHLFVGNHLLNESGMERHPLNPMSDADIRRWLARQCRQPVGLVEWPIVSRGPREIELALQSAASRGETLVIVDALDDGDLIAIGRACRNSVLLTGGSGIALGLTQNFLHTGEAKGESTPFSGINGPEAVFAGSCSGATLRQIAIHARSHPAISLDLDAVMNDRLTSSFIVDFALSNTGREPLIYSSDTPEKVQTVQSRYGQDKVASKLDALFATAAGELMNRGLKRLVVAGGETSGAVAAALGLRELSIGPEIAPGVPVLFTNTPKGVALALKSGNFGGPDFFSQALSLLKSGTG